MEREMTERNMILLIRSGSHLYGTNTEESDEDFVGVFVPDPEYLLGLKRIKEVDLSVGDKDGSGKNTKDAVDKKIYSLDQFVRLALDNNPNILELLFVNDANIVAINDIGRELLSLRYKFLSKNIKHRFIGYAHSQKHKMVIKLENYEHIEGAIEYLKKADIEFINEIKHHPIFKQKKQVITVGDTNLPANITRKKALQSLERRAKKFGSRRELVSKHGFDTKFALNLIRLLKEGIELLTEEDLKFPLKSAPLLLKIKRGAYSLDQVLQRANDLEKIVEEWYDTTSLPNKPDFHTIESFVIKTHKNIICGG